MRISSDLMKYSTKHSLFIYLFIYLKWPIKIVFKKILILVIEYNIVLFIMLYIVITILNSSSFLLNKSRASNRESRHILLFIISSDSYIVKFVIFDIWFWLRNCKRTSLYIFQIFHSLISLVLTIFVNFFYNVSYNR